MVASPPTTPPLVTHLERLSLLGMPADQQTAVLERCATLAQAHYPSLTLDFLQREFLAPDVRRSRIGLLTDQNGALRGWQILASRPVEIERKRLMVVRSGVCKERGVKLPSRAFETYGPTELVRQAVESWMAGRTPWVVASSLSPVTYYRMSAYFPDMVPTPRRDAVANPEAERWLHAMANATGFSMLPGRSYCCAFPGTDVLTDAERERWHTHPSPAVQRYLELCPDFGQGAVLVFGIPLPPRTVLALPFRAMANVWTARKKKRRTQPRE
jgi:hypothetical protein